jgi:DNA replication factor GINS
MGRVEELQKIERSISKLESNLEDMRSRLSALKEELHVEPFTYDDLTEIARLEQRNRTIAPIRKDFYDASKREMASLKDESEKEFKADQFSTKSKLASNQLLKFQEKYLQVIEFRLEKIADMAIRLMIGHKVDGLDRLAPEECQVFSKISDAVDEHLDYVRGASK